MLLILAVNRTDSFSEKRILERSQTKSMDPPQTKKQYIKNQKEKAASTHRLGTKKHVRQVEQRKRTR